jgi:hypothetical protein
MVIMVCQQPGDRHGLTDNTILDRLSARTNGASPAGWYANHHGLDAREAGGRLWPEARLNYRISHKGQR